LYLGDDLYAGNALVKNRDGRAYIKIINTRDTDERIVASEVELEELDKIVISRLKNSSPYDKDIQTRTVNVMVTDNIQNTQNTQSCSLRELLHLNHLNKEEAIHVDRIINKYSDLFRLRDELLGHTKVIRYKIVTIDDRLINTKQYRFPAFHKNEINK